MARTIELEEPRCENCGESLKKVTLPKHEHKGEVAYDVEAFKCLLCEQAWLSEYQITKFKNKVI